MQSAPLAPNEQQRLALLQGLQLLDSAPEPVFDSLTRLAARLLGVPIALLSLVDSQRQWFKSRVGLEAPETPREVAFCAHAILGEQALVVPDAWLDPRFADNPLVTGNPHVRAYAGVPLRSSEGLALGTLCAIDHRPHAFGPLELELLEELAALAQHEIRRREQTLQVRDLAQRGLQAIDTQQRMQQALDRLEAREQSLRQGEVDLRAVLEGAHEAFVAIDAQSRVIEWNREAEQTLGWPRAEVLGQAIDALIIPPELRESHRRGLQRLMQTGEAKVLNQRLELPALCRDGRRIQCELTLGALPASARGPLYFAFLHDISERKALEQRLAQSRERLQDLYDHAPCGYYSLGPDGRFVQINLTLLDWLECDSRDEVLGQLGPADFMDADSRALFQHKIARFVAGERLLSAEYDLIGRRGRQRRVSVSATAVQDAEGRFLKSRSVMYDITELAQTRAELQRLTRNQALMLDNELIGIVRLKDRASVWQNRAFERMFGYSDGELLSQSARMIYPDDASFERVGQLAYPALQAGRTYRGQLQLRRKDGSLIWVDMSGVLLDAAQGESMWLMLDINAAMQHQQQVEHLAFHDALTGLANRLLLRDHLELALAAMQRSGRQLALAFIDLDGFKAVNDQRGHEAGDRLLQTIAQRLQGCVRAVDTVARLGGDEFVLLLAELHGRGEAETILQRVLAEVARPVDLPGGAQGRVTASIGAACAPADAAQAEALLALADAAMYRAKQAGKSRLHWHADTPA